MIFLPERLIACPHMNDECYPRQVKKVSTACTLDATSCATYRKGQVCNYMPSLKDQGW